MTFKMGFIAFRMKIVSIRKCIVDMDIVSDVTHMCQNDIKTCGHTIFMTQCYPLIVNDVNVFPIECIGNRAM